MRHTVVIPSHNTLSHLKNTYESLKRYAPDYVDIIIIDDASEDGTADWLQSLDDSKVTTVLSSQRKGHTFWYDEGMRIAKTETASILHSDMIIGPGYFENLLKHLSRRKVVCATRIEPPIHPAGKEKIVRDFGDEAETFNFDAFEKFVIDQSQKDKDVSTRGIFAPWAVYVSDHLYIGGHDQRFTPYGYEDSDIFNRWILDGLEMVQSRDALVYHMTCRGHRWNKGIGIENADYKDTMSRCEREYIRKWGDWISNDEFQYPIINPKYDVGIKITSCNSNILETLEPWCSTILIDDEMQVLTSYYLDREQSRTVVDLSSKIKTTPYQHLETDIEVIVDATTFTTQDYIYIRQLAAILSHNKPDPGKFMLGNLQVTVNKLQEYTDKLIKV